MVANKDRALKFDLLETVQVRAWDNSTKSFSTTRTREQKVYKINWL